MTKLIKVERNNVHNGYNADFYIGSKKYYADVTYAPDYYKTSECMIFQYNEDGSINWHEVYVNRDVSVTEEDLLKCINEFIESERKRRTKQIKIEELIPLMRDGWVACDEDGTWNWYYSKPHKNTKYNLWVADERGIMSCFSRPFNVAPAEDWTKSLIKIERK